MEQLKPRDKRADNVLPDTTAQKSNQFVDRATILYFAGRLAETAAAKRAASKAHDAVRKQFKNAGVSLSLFDTVSSLVSQDDGIEAVLSFGKEFQHIASVFAVPVGTQMGLFEGPASAASVTDKARDDGYMRGVMGQNCDEQAYPPSTDLGQAHLAGWHDGQEVRQKQFLAHNEQVRQAEAAKKAERDEKARKKAERDAAKVPKTEAGDTVQ